jgi:hypothetical protein
MRRITTHAATINAAKIAQISLESVGNSQGGNFFQVQLPADDGIPFSSTSIRVNMSRMLLGDQWELFVGPIGWCTGLNEQQMRTYPFFALFSGGPSVLMGTIDTGIQPGPPAQEPCIIYRCNLPASSFCGPFRTSISLYVSSPTQQFCGSGGYMPVEPISISPEWKVDTAQRCAWPPDSSSFTDTNNYPSVSYFPTAGTYKPDLHTWCRGSSVCFSQANWPKPTTTSRPSATAKATVATIATSMVTASPAVSVSASNGAGIQLAGGNSQATSGPSVGVIAGVAGATLIALAVAAGAAWYYMKRSADVSPNIQGGTNLDEGAIKPDAAAVSAPPTLVRPLPAAGATAGMGSTLPQYSNPMH